MNKDKLKKYKLLVATKDDKKTFIPLESCIEGYSDLYLIEDGTPYSGISIETDYLSYLSGVVSTIFGNLMKTGELVEGNYNIKREEILYMVLIKETDKSYTQLIKYAITFIK